MSSFVRGFSSVLDVYGCDEKDDLCLEYKGRDLAETTVQQAFVSDWEALIGTKYEVDDDEEE